MEKANNQKIVIALRKAKSSLEKILVHAEAGDDTKAEACFSVIQQTLSVIGLLKSANLLMLENHMDRQIGRRGGANAKHLKALQAEILKIVKTSQNK